MASSVPTATTALIDKRRFVYHFGQAADPSNFLRQLLPADTAGSTFVLPEPGKPWAQSNASRRNPQIG
jgi:hypothetical protein